MRYTGNMEQQSEPKTLLDRLYYIGLGVKALDGLMELAAGVLLWVIPSATIIRFTQYLTDAELHQDPHNFIATHVLHSGLSLAGNGASFAIIFLLIHGTIKLGLVVFLLLGKMWAYPVGLSLLGILTLYQVYEISVKPSIGMVLLTVLDGFIIWLIWREWHQAQSRKQAARANDTILR